MPTPMPTPILSVIPMHASLRRPTLEPVASAAAAARRVSSQSLLEGGRELVIQHQGSEYHLRLTRNDKLILTK
ncbi:hemin uptake protein HemP [Rhodanobacter sp. MP7CTX1]|jgi:hemin uptake protein HemP|uniref:hemin uptake protein HemP n=1 Tax=Rhodanobacter sp. MP7CTX1 TaxID=2723084 RepID=UPI001811CF43|nr:hemin uptake protein HemP [Rhodanobacter sp. MP7CTX1]MBB6187377.1 hemin uptake protein HemP [Rhodanobacter sp. MP7CTX1]